MEIIIRNLPRHGGIRMLKILTVHTVIEKIPDIDVRNRSSEPTRHLVANINRQMVIGGGKTRQDRRETRVVDVHEMNEGDRRLRKVVTSAYDAEVRGI